LPGTKSALHITSMSDSAPNLESLQALSVAERIQLVEDLWDSIAAEAPDDAFPISAELGAELDRRAAEADAAPTGGLEWSEVRRAIENRSLRLEP
jgi:putative addiction module component (TIGR02574 family)